MTDQPAKGPASYFPSIEKTYTKPIAEWKALIRARPPAKNMEHVAWLKQEHGMGHGHANALVAHSADAAEALLSARLAPDMFPLATQVRFACVQSPSHEPGL